MLTKTTKLMLTGYLLVLLGLLSACETMIHSRAGTTTTVIMIRHADRTPFGSALTPRGHKNAKALIAAIGDMNIHRYSTTLSKTSWH